MHSVFLILVQMQLLRANELSYPFFSARALRVNDLRILIE